MVSSHIYYHLVKAICGQIKVVINILYKKLILVVVGMAFYNNLPTFLYNFLLIEITHLLLILIALNVPILYKVALSVDNGLQI